MNDFKYTIWGNPVPCARPRTNFTLRRVFDSQKDIKFAYGVNLVRQHGLRPLFMGPLHMDVVFYLNLPKLSIKKTELLRGVSHNSKPDLDNLIKLISDAANGILFKDDAAISSISAAKYYDDGKGARTELIMRQL